MALRLDNPAAKEVLRYRQALRVGFEAVRQSGLLTANDIIGIQAELERNTAGLRKLPGTELKDGAGRTVYTPPQDHRTIVALMRDLERFFNEPDCFDADPLIKMALVHHQFESIHRFYDGNGRTGRIINVLYRPAQLERERAEAEAKGDEEVSGERLGTSRDDNSE